MTHVSTTAATPAETGQPGNQAAIAAIRAHHAELVEQLNARTAEVLEVARTDAAASSGDSARDELHAWYRGQLMPHIVAEERALYAPAAELDVTRLLVRGMLAEHKALVARIADLGLAPTRFATAVAAASAQALFTIHVDKENDLLLPALDEAGVDLASALANMHEAIPTAESSADDAYARGCDHGDDAYACGCDHGHDGAQGVQFGAPRQYQSAVDGPSAAAGELDVRTLPHGHRHEVIFGRLQALSPGESLLIVNDHDPKPLRYQTEALWPGRFTWAYREAGPQSWRMAITRAG